MKEKTGWKLQKQRKTCEIEKEKSTPNRNKRDRECEKARKD